MERLDDAHFWDAASEAFANHNLELTLLPTEQCNLRCIYCYEKFERGRMSPGVVDAVKLLIGRRAPELKKLTIDWFGGEPLMATDIMEDIGGFATRLQADHPDLQLKSSVTTNGVLLTPKVAQRLAEVGIRAYHVSLDGPEQFHDKTRKMIGGRGTYERIKNNLLQLRDGKLDIKVELRVHITSENLASLDPFAEELANTYLDDPRFSIYFFPIADLGGPNRGQFPVLNDRVAKAALDRLSRRVKRRLPEESAEEAHYVCYAAKPNAWVIRSDGRLAKCTVALDDPKNNVGELRADGTLSIRSEPLKAWMRGWTSRSRKELFCPLDNLMATLDLPVAAAS
jgi:uncharacterized protein